jgi:two-component system cell cycle response regulator
MSLPNCERFGFTAEKIRERLALLQLGDKDRELAGRLQQEVIVPRFPQIMNEFMAAIVDQPEAQLILTDEDIKKRVKHTITTFLLSLGSGFDSAKYFEHRLHVGLAHEKVGLSLSLYLCAYRCLTQCIINQFPDPIRSDQPYYEKLVEFLYKVNALDMSLAIDTFHGSQVQVLQARQEQLRLKAITDSLTGLVNHDHVFSELERAMQNAKLSEQPLCVVMTDIDYFKKVNDNHGHQAGDAVLIDVSKRIKASLRELDIVGRYGGEEFMLILHETPLDVATRIAERIRLKIADHPINLTDLILHITMSFGVSLAKEDDTVETLVKRADDALYAAKHGGRNQVVVGD